MSNELLKKLASLPPEKRAAIIAKLAKGKSDGQNKSIDFTGNIQFSFRSETPFDFQLQETTVGDPGPDFVQIEAKAASLNFRDVMIATKQYSQSPGVPANMGSDYAGVVTKVGENIQHLQPGDEVITLFIGHSETDGTLRDNCHFIKTFNVHHYCVVKKPKNLTFQEACCIPTVFLTSFIGLIELGRLEQGNKVLIHTATGGVGLSALQIAAWKGAEVYATAGTDEKRKFLSDYGIKHIYSSRTTEFAEVLEKENVGLDVVLNTVAGELMQRGIPLLQPFGRFIHIDKKDIAKHTSLDLHQLIQGIAFQFLDISMLFRQPQLIQSALKEIIDLHDEGHFTSLHHEVFAISDLKKAITAMSRGTHIGKLVVSYS